VNVTKAADKHTIRQLVANQGIPKVRKLLETLIEEFRGALDLSDQGCHLFLIYLIDFFTVCRHAWVPAGGEGGQAFDPDHRRLAQARPRSQPRCT
jgi:hypothetical protein